MDQEQSPVGHQTKLEPTPKFHYSQQLIVFYNKETSISTLLSFRITQQFASK